MKAIKKIIIAIAVAGYIYAMGAVSRLIGSGSVPKLVGKLAFAVLATIPFPIISYLTLGSAFALWYVYTGVFVLTAILCNMGHADFFYTWKGIRDQFLSPVAAFIYKKLFGSPVDRTNWRYDAIGMTLVGMSATLPAAIGFAIYGQFIGALMCLIGGGLKSVAYGSGLADDVKTRANYTEDGEWRRGWFAGASIIIAAVLAIVGG